MQSHSPTWCKIKPKKCTSSPLQSRHPLTDPFSNCCSRFLLYNWIWSGLREDVEMYFRFVAGFLAICIFEIFPIQKSMAQSRECSITTQGVRAQVLYKVRPRDIKASRDANCFLQAKRRIHCVRLDNSFCFMEMTGSGRQIVVPFGGYLIGNPPYGIAPCDLTKDYDPGCWTLLARF